MTDDSRWHAVFARLWKEWAVSVALGALALLACAKIGEDVFAHETGGFDDAIQHWVAAHQNPVADAVFLAVTYSGSVGASLVAALAAALWFWRARGRRIAAATLIAPAVATALFVALKNIFARARPPVIALSLRTYSFPSGHATSSTAVWCTLAYVAWREGLATRRQALPIAILVPLLVGVSRVYLDVHWATDVLGGWSLGLLVTIVGVVLYDRHRLRAMQI